MKALGDTSAQETESEGGGSGAAWHKIHKDFCGQEDNDRQTVCTQETRRNGLHAEGKENCHRGGYMCVGSVRVGQRGKGL